VSFPLHFAECVGMVNALAIRDTKRVHGPHHVTGLFSYHVNKIDRQSSPAVGSDCKKKKRFACPLALFSPYFRLISALVLPYRDYTLRAQAITT